MNKNFKLEFVVFNISQENATFLWKFITRFIEFIGFDVTGDVTDNDDLAPDGFPK